MLAGDVAGLGVDVSIRLLPGLGRLVGGSRVITRHEHAASLIVSTAGTVISVRLEAHWRIARAAGTDWKSCLWV